jgi:hypothetical protein
MVIHFFPCRVARQWQAEAQRNQQVAQQWQQFNIAQVPGDLPLQLRLLQLNSEHAEKIVVEQLQAQVAQLEQQLQYGWEAFEAQGRELAQCQAQLTASRVNGHREEVESIVVN